MRKTLLGIAGTAALLLAGTSAGFAGDVNCGIVNKDLKMGRTPQDISERMMISGRRHQEVPGAGERRRCR